MTSGQENASHRRVEKWWSKCAKKQTAFVDVPYRSQSPSADRNDTDWEEKDGGDQEKSMVDLINCVGYWR